MRISDIKNAHLRRLVVVIFTPPALLFCMFAGAWDGLDAFISEVLPPPIKECWRDADAA